jgi:hypothetical protein
VRLNQAGWRGFVRHANSAFEPFEADIEPQLSSEKAALRRR